MSENAVNALREEPLVTYVRDGAGPHGGGGGVLAPRFDGGVSARLLQQEAGPLLQLLLAGQRSL